MQWFVLCVQACFCVSRTWAARLRSLCFCACGVRSHRLALECQSIKWRGPVSHQGAVHDCQCLDAQKFAPPRRESPLRGKDSSVTQTTVPIRNDRCAVWLKRMTAQYRRLNSKYMWRHWHTTGVKCWSTCMVMIMKVQKVEHSGMCDDYSLFVLFSHKMHCFKIMKAILWVAFSNSDAILQSTAKDNLKSSKSKYKQLSFFTGPLCF